VYQPVADVKPEEQVLRIVRIQGIGHLEAAERPPSPKLSLRGFVSWSRGQGGPALNASRSSIIIGDDVRL
jgi:hypothetical protein